MWGEVGGEREFSLSKRGERDIIGFWEKWEEQEREREREREREDRYIDRAKYMAGKEEI